MLGEHVGGGDGIGLLQTQPSQMDLVTNYHWQYGTQIRLTGREGEKKSGGVKEGKRTNNGEKKNPLLQLMCDLLQGPEKNNEWEGQGQGKEKRCLIFLHHTLHIELNFRVYFLTAFKLPLWLRWGYSHRAKELLGKISHGLWQNTARDKSWVSCKTCTNTYAHTHTHLQPHTRHSSFKEVSARACVTICTHTMSMQHTPSV